MTLIWGADLNRLHIQGTATIFFGRRGPRAPGRESERQNSLWTREGPTNTLCEAVFPKLSVAQRYERRPVRKCRAGTLSRPICEQFWGAAPLLAKHGGGPRRRNNWESVFDRHRLHQR